MNEQTTLAVAVGAEIARVFGPAAIAAFFEGNEDAPGAGEAGWFACLDAGAPRPPAGYAVAVFADIELSDPAEAGFGYAVYVPGVERPLYFCKDAQINSLSPVLRHYETRPDLRIDGPDDLSTKERCGPVAAWFVGR